MVSSVASTSPTRPPGDRVRGALAAALRAPVSGQTWREVGYWLASLPVSAAGFVLVLGALAAGTALTVSLLGAVLGLTLLTAAMSLANGLGRVQRRLARAMLGVRISAPPLAPPWTGGIFGRLDRALRSSRNWRAVAYVLIRGPLAFFGTYLMAAFWLTGLFYLSYPVFWSVWHQHVQGPFPAGEVHITTLGEAFLIFLLAVPVLLAAPWVGRGLVAIDGWLLRNLLAPVSLTERVRELERTRAMAVDDAVAQLRRVERDLHDGAQARLVAIAMTLGMAREKLGDAGPAQDAASARDLLDAAHASAKQAIAEVRDLARGIHPPVLDNGLPDALATLAAQSSVPVTFAAEIGPRPTPAIEAIAYFCAAELIANVGKHSGASTASLQAVARDGTLRLRVWDNGRGGARAEPGGGLTGLAERVRTVDGTMHVDSPAGGPTAVQLELPLHA